MLATQYLSEKRKKQREVWKIQKLIRYANKSSTEQLLEFRDKGIISATDFDVKQK
jgi:hypothetical protein